MAHFAKRHNDEGYLYSEQEMVVVVVVGGKMASGLLLTQMDYKQMEYNKQNRTQVIDRRWRGRSGIQIEQKKNTKCLDLR